MQDTIDPAAVKYLLLAEKGENIDIVFLQTSVEDSPPKIFMRSHIQSDGIGALLDLMKIDGTHIQKGPVLKHSGRPPLFKRLLLMREHLKRQAPIDYSWKKIDRRVTGVSAGIAYLTFSVEQTTRLNEFCKNHECNLNGLILWSIDYVARERYLMASQKRVWMVPVNIRLQENEMGNKVTALSVNIFDGDSPGIIYRQIKSMLQGGLYWGGMIVANLPRYIGVRALRFLTKNLKSPYMGIVTNLGNWNHGPSVERLLVSAPATSFCPIAIGVMTWNGSLGMSCQLHPSLSKNIQETDQLLEDCKNKLLEYAGMNAMLKTSSIAWETVAKEGKRI